MLNDFLYSTLTSIHCSQRSTMSNKIPLNSSPYVLCNRTKFIENQICGRKIYVTNKWKETVDYKTDVAGRCCGNVVSICNLGSTYIIYKIVVDDHHDFTTPFLCKWSGGSRESGCILISRTIYWYLLHSRILWGDASPISTLEASCPSIIKSCIEMISSALHTHRWSLNQWKTSVLGLQTLSACSSSRTSYTCRLHQHCYFPVGQTCSLGIQFFKIGFCNSIHPRIHAMCSLATGTLMYINRSSLRYFDHKVDLECNLLNSRSAMKPLVQWSSMAKNSHSYLRPIYL